MRYFITLLFTAITLNSSAIAQQNRIHMTISSGMGKSCTVGGLVVGYSSGIPNKLWQGFWIPKNVTTTIKEDVLAESKYSTLMPNPATTHLSISTKKDIEYVSLYTTTGELIYSIQHSNIPVANLNSNVYIVRIVYKDNTIDTHKLVVSH